MASRKSTRIMVIGSPTQFFTWSEKIGVDNCEMLRCSSGMIFVECPERYSRNIVGGIFRRKYFYFVSFSGHRSDLRRRNADLAYLIEKISVNYLLFVWKRERII